MFPNKEEERDLPSSNIHFINFRTNIIVLILNGQMKTILHATRVFIRRSQFLGIERVNIFFKWEAMFSYHWAWWVSLLWCIIISTFHKLFYESLVKLNRAQSQQVANIHKHYWTASMPQMMSCWWVTLRRSWGFSARWKFFGVVTIF